MTEPNISDVYNLDHFAAPAVQVEGAEKGTVRVPGVRDAIRDANGRVFTYDRLSGDWAIADPMVKATFTAD